MRIAEVFGSGDFKPSYPFYMIWIDGGNMVIDFGGYVFTTGFATRELAELMVQQLHDAFPDDRSEIVVVENKGHFTILADGLLRRRVTHMSWNATTKTQAINLVDLSDFESVLPSRKLPFFLWEDFSNLPDTPSGDSAQGDMGHKR
jgi:hypothetical protein